MEPDAPATVIKGALATCLAGALYGASYGTIKRQPPWITTVTASLNSGLAGLTFFALREYVAGPILVETIPWQPYLRKREAIRVTKAGGSIPIFTNWTFSEARTHKLLDSAIAGSGASTLLHLFKRGPAGVVPGAVTAGLFCTLVQFVCNELEVTRIKLVLRVRRSSETTPAQVRPRVFSEKLIDGLGVILPVTKLSDEEYMQKLIKEREEVERRLEGVRTELEGTTERKDDN